MLLSQDYAPEQCAKTGAVSSRGKCIQYHTYKCDILIIVRYVLRNVGVKE